MGFEPISPASQASILHHLKYSHHLDVLLRFELRRAASEAAVLPLHNKTMLGQLDSTPLRLD